MVNWHSQKPLEQEMGSLSKPMGIDYVVIGFDIEVQPLSLTFMLCLPIRRECDLQR